MTAHPHIRLEGLRPLLNELRLPKPVYVTRTRLPRIEDYLSELEPAWNDAWLTNDGPLQRRLRDELLAFLEVEHLTLCCNGTIGLMVALRAAGIDGGEVITTPFTFPATIHALHWSGVRPVFGDVDPATFNLDAGGIEALIGPDTRAILPVHVMGYPCDVEAFAAIAKAHGLRLIYDAAHAMGVTLRGRSLLHHGDLAVLSFHATKLFTTGEGGGIVCRSASEQEQLRLLCNFGIAGEESLVGTGINGKMSELHAALGLVQLRGLDAEIARCGELTESYRDGLRSVPGIEFREDLPEVRHNYHYFPVLVDADAYGIDRDELCALLREFNVVPRKYFHPLCSRIAEYASLPSASPDRLPVAERVSRSVLCLPLYGELREQEVQTICRIVSALAHPA